MKTRYIYLSLAAVCIGARSLGAVACTLNGTDSPAVRDSLAAIDRVAVVNDVMAQTAAEVYEASNAAAIWRYPVSLSSIGLRLDLRREQEAAVRAEGDGLTAGCFEAGSYMHLDSRSTVEAEASYTRGVKRNVLWNSTSDYDLLYPHVVADTVGGDLTSEQYAFAGGYAHRGDRFVWGAMASYRALHEFRQVDPRPRNITSDLSADVSGGFDLGSRYVGVTAGVRVYRQNQQVDYYDTNGANTSQIPMTGLGTYFDRYSGAGDGTTSYTYKGSGYGVSLQSVPKDGCGWSAMAAYERFGFERLLRSGNKVPITALKRDTYSAVAAWRSPRSMVEWGVELGAEYENRKGDENVIDNGALGVNNVLATFTMYDLRRGGVSLGGVVRFRNRAGYLFVRPHVAWRSVREGYRYPQRSMSVSALVGGCDIGYRIRHGRWLADITAGGGYTHALASSLKLPVSVETALREMVGYDFERASDEPVTAGAALDLNYGASTSVAAFVSLGWRMYVGHANASGHMFSGSVGVRF